MRERRGSSRRTGCRTARGRPSCGKGSRSTTAACTSERRAARSGPPRAGAVGGPMRQATCRRSSRSKPCTSEVAIVLLPAMLAAEAGGQKRFEFQATTVGERRTYYQPAHPPGGWDGGGTPEGVSLPDRRVSHPGRRRGGRGGWLEVGRVSWGRSS